MWRCQREKLKEDAIQCCGEKQCEELYLESFPRGQYCREEEVEVRQSKGSCLSHNGCDRYKCPGGWGTDENHIIYGPGVYGNTSYNYNCYSLERKTMKVCEYAAKTVSCPAIKPVSPVPGASCDYGSCSRPKDSIVTHYFDLDDKTDPTSCAVKYKRIKRNASACDNRSDSGPGGNEYNTVPYIVCDKERVNSGCMVYYDDQIMVSPPSGSSGAVYKTEERCFRSTYFFTY